MNEPSSIIFDIDGTLIDSFITSGTEYKNAVLQILPDAVIKPQWKDYQNVTDSGIIIEVLQDNAYDLAVRETIAQIKQVFMENTSQSLEKNPCEIIEGAQYFLNACRSKYKVGIATGCWKEAAEMKLRTAGFDWGNTYLSSACDFDTREDILENCLKQIVGAEKNVVYFGDAEWDIKTTTNLNWHFVGIGEKLKDKCPNWFLDYSEPEKIFEVISKLLEKN